MSIAKPQIETLTPAVFYILLALSRENLHGYGIMKQVAEDSNNSVKMGPGTLYGSLQRMLTDGLVEETEGPKGQGERRKYYRITALGKKLLAGQLEQYKLALSVAKKLNLELK